MIATVECIFTGYEWGSPSIDVWWGGVGGKREVIRYKGQ